MLVVLTTASLLVCGPPVMARKLSTAKRDPFEQHIRRRLLANGIKCHDDRRQEGGFNLSTMEGSLHAGDSGPAIVRGKPNERRCGLR